MARGVLHDHYTSELLAAQRGLYSYILTLVPNLSDADDVLQDTNSVLLRKYKELQPGTSFVAWARQVAYFEALAWRKRQGRQKCILGDDDLLERLATEAGEHYDALDRRIAALEQCMEELTARDRDLIGMRYRENLSSASMAGRLGRTAEAVRRHLYRLRAALLRCIEGRLKGPEGA